MLDVLLFAIGLGLVLLGGNWLVSGAVQLSPLLGLRPAVVGITIVGFGTSAPELAISGIASATGSPETALGNALGSNVANVGLVLGLGALVSRLPADSTLVHREAPIMAGVSVAVFALSWTGTFEWWTGAVMLLGLAAFLTMSLVWTGSEDPNVALTVRAAEETPGGEPAQRVSRARAALMQVPFLVGGLVLLVFGARVLVDAAEGIAESLGVPEVVIAATIIAVGTSVPELVTTAVAAFRGEAALAVGNVIGSNVFNLLGVIGLAAVIAPIPITSDVRALEFSGMLAFGLAAAAMAYTGRVISRGEGAILVGGYVTFLVLAFL